MSSAKRYMYLKTEIHKVIETAVLMIMSLFGYQPINSARVLTTINLYRVSTVDTT